MANKHMKGNSMSTVITEMHIKATVIYLFTSHLPGKAIIKKTSKFGEDVEKLEAHRVTIRSSISLLGIYNKKT